MELSEKDVNQLRGEQEDSIQAVQRREKKAEPEAEKNVFVKKSFSSHNRALKCYRCGGENHLASKCSLDINTICRGCGVAGHLQRVCMRFKGSKLNQVAEIFRIKEEDTKFREKYSIKLKVEGKDIIFEIDSGAVVTLMGKSLFDSFFPPLPSVIQI